MSQRFRWCELRMRKVGLFVLAGSLLLTGLGAHAAVNESSMKVTWGYKGSIGPEFWGRLSPEFILCGKGKEQSPVNIAQNDQEAPNTLSMKYTPAPMFIMEDGATNLLIGEHQLVVNDGHTVQVNFHQDGPPEYVIYKGEKYRLVQFHFHSPSENQLNGEAAPLEVHFVHQSDNGKVLVIGVLVKGGAANPALETIIQHIPAADGKEYAVKDAKIFPADLMPLDNDHYSFPGSLTTPPCTEGLQWVVMAATVTASPAEIATIRHAIGGSNARAVQPLNNRAIKYSISRSG